MKIGVFGGTFNPIHYGHLRAAEEAREVLGLDKVLFIPSGTPPLKKDDIAGAGHRFEMTVLAAAGNPSFEVLDLETIKPEKSYTVETLEALQNMYSGSSLYFLLGVDAFLDIPNWWRPERLISLSNFVVLSRPGGRFRELLASPYISAGTEALESLDSGELRSVTINLETSREAALLNVTSMAISSRDIRRRLKEGLSLKYLLPEAVESYIFSKKLYIINKKQGGCIGVKAED